MPNDAVGLMHVTSSKCRTLFQILKTGCSRKSACQRISPCAYLIDCQGRFSDGYDAARVDDNAAWLQWRM